MRIKNRLYPYPILREKVGDYLHSTFKSEVAYGFNENQCVLTFDLECTNREINTMIASGSAVFGVHIECKYTYYRVLKTTSERKFSIPIDANRVDRVLEICPTIIATEDIVGYTNTDLDVAYNGEIINVKRGDPLAIGAQTTVNIVKERDPLKKMSSPFCVLPYPDTEAMPAREYATVSYTESDQIIIYLPKDDHAILSRIQDDAINRNTIHSALYYPALIEVLDYMKTEASEEDQEKRWYIALNSKAEEKGIGDIKSSDLTAFEIAQQLFGEPISRWLKGYDN